MKTTLFSRQFDDWYGYATRTDDVFDDLESHVQALREHVMRHPEGHWCCFLHPPITRRQHEVEVLTH